ncbi:MAG: hypothetical protein FWB86_00795 [Treponema sp.]|nr:hypothetical protein [Treponema sp.]MCL2250633.1 hypothetical protein [Treponema sp.]
MKDPNFNAKLIGYNHLEVEKYLNDLRLVGSISKLFSESQIPYLHYRVTELIYCLSFNAENLARADLSVDAKLKSNGIGIKTFIETEQMQKIAEFNNQQRLYKTLSSLDKVKKIAELRNNRLDFTLKVYGLKDIIYHCIVRNEKGFWLFEEKMDFIDITKIKITKENKNTLFFFDGKEEYKFDTTKSTLYKRFKIKECFAFVPVVIFDDPLGMLRKINYNEIMNEQEITFPETIIVPLYSTSRSGKKVVYARSGLNQWNAKGRRRELDEVYIPWNTILKNSYDTFFPPRKTPFEVKLPNDEILLMSICQAGGKAIMSNPNKALGKWLLRDVLGIKQRTLVTYEMLLEIGIDAVAFQKLGEGKYMLDFRKVGEYEKFLEKEVMPDD